jgi:arylsulfatase
MRTTMLLCVLVLSALCPVRAVAESVARKPNIVLILADDLGYSDLGCYGGEIRTPNLDALAARGLRFTQFYNAARCCPTRASLMTGLYPHQAGVGRMTTGDAGAQFPGYRGALSRTTPTVAEALRAAGYRTAMAGKWHLSLTKEGPDHMRHVSNQVIADTFSDPAGYPVARGFERHYGIIWGVANYFDPFSLVDGTTPVRQVPNGYYITDAITEHAVKDIGDFANGPEPFFLYVAYTAPHWPLHAPKEDIDRNVATYARGWDAVRAERFRRIAEMNLLPNAELPAPQGRRVAWEQDPAKDWDARAMATHAAMVERMDAGVGRIVAKLRETGALDDTLVLFLSDNGASPEAYGQSGFDRPAETRDGRTVHYPPDKSVPPGGDDTCFGIGPAWANVANAPLRYWKAEAYEGGIRTPMVAHWPRGVKAPPGSLTNQVGHVIDLMPTFLEMAGAELPREFNGSRTQPPEGRSLLPVFASGRREPALLGWEHFGAKALRQGDWKIVARPNRRWELYDLSNDPTELHDLAAEQPERVKQMAAEWDQWAKRVDVYPAPK